MAQAIAIRALGSCRFPSGSAENRKDSTSVVPAARHFERGPRFESRRARTTARMEPGLRHVRELG